VGQHPVIAFSSIRIVALSCRIGWFLIGTVSISRVKAARPSHQFEFRTATIGSRARRWVAFGAVIPWASESQTPDRSLRH
jgi:hypothetical protein